VTDRASFVNPSPWYIDQNYDLNPSVTSNLPYDHAILVKNANILEISASFVRESPHLNAANIYSAWLEKSWFFVNRPKFHAESNPDFQFTIRLWHSAQTWKNR
jgi:hypothetical protein